MNKTSIYNLNNHDINDLFTDLNLEEMETILGGGVADPFSNIWITTIHGDANTNSPSSTNYGPGTVNENKVNTIDHSRSTYIWVVS